MGSPASKCECAALLSPSSPRQKLGAEKGGVEVVGDTESLIVYIDTLHLWTSCVKPMCVEFLDSHKITFFPDCD